ncbi:MAG: hypothetical protein IPH36_00005, partial [Saprospiraceae bacterium]|nr:hypothetical protein [Saprospiraceae bacterium]
YPVWLYFIVLLFAISGLGLWARSQWWGSNTNDQPESTKTQISDNDPLAMQGKAENSQNLNNNGFLSTESQPIANNAKVEAGLTLEGNGSKSNPSQPNKTAKTNINNFADKYNANAAADGATRINPNETTTSSFPSILRSR